MRSVRVVAWVLAGLASLGGAAAAALWFGGGPLLAWAIEHPLAAAVGRRIAIGRLAVDWGSPTRIVIDDLHVANASWGDGPDLFAARRLEVALDPASLLATPRLPLIAIDGGKLLLETSARGAHNWDIALRSTAPKTRRQFPDLRYLRVGDSELVYRNGKTGAVSDIGITSLEMSEPDPQGSVRVAATGSFQRLPLHLTASLGPIAALRGSSEPYPVRLAGGIGTMAFAVEGGIARPLDFAGADLRFSLAGRGLDALAGALGVPMPALPDFRGTAKLRGGDGKWAVDALSVKLGASDLEGGLAIDATTTVPQVRANLTASYLDLADFKGAVGGSPAHSTAPAAPPDRSGRVLPDTRIDVHKLPGIDVVLAFYGTRIKSPGGVPLERVALGLKLEKGELVLDPLRFAAADGDLDLTLHFTPFTRATPPRMRAVLHIRHVNLHKLLAGPAVPAMVKETAGTAGGFVDIVTDGVSVRQWLANMNGDAALFLQHGQSSALLQELAPIDVLGALGVYLTGDHPVPIDCFVSRFTIRQGIATASTLLVDTPDTAIVGTGTVDFASEILHLDLMPHNRRFTTLSLRSPVEVRGSFGKPAFSVQWGGLLGRLGAAVGLGVLFPPAALLPLIDAGLGPGNACRPAAGK